MDPERVEYLKTQVGRKTVPALRAEGYIRLDNLIAAGFKANELKASGYRLNRPVYDVFDKLGRRKDLIAAGFNEMDFDAIGISASDLKLAGLSCADLLRVGWSVSTLKLPQFYGEDVVNQTLKELAGAQHDISLAKKAVPVPMLKSAGFTIEEMKEAGFNAADLKSQGGWDSDEEKENVDEIYGAEEVWRELEVLGQTRSVPVSLKQIGDARNSYLEAVKTLMTNRDERRTLERQLEQVERRIEEAKKWVDRLRAEAKLKEDKERIEQLRNKRIEDEELVKERRKLLVDTIDKRIKHLKDQIKFQQKKSKAIRTDIRDKLDALNHPFGAISCYNHELIRKSYPLINLSPDARRQRIDEAERELGVPETVDFSSLKHPVEELQPAKPGSKKKKWVSSEESQYKRKPLEYLAFLEAKKEKVEWIISDHEAEIELLENVKEVAKNAKALWRPVASKAVYHTLLGLARYSTTEVRMPFTLSKSVVQSPLKWRRITGKIEFNLEIGASVGVGSGAVASAKVGLNIALSGSLAVEDDQRVRVRLSLKLIPNLEVNFYPGGLSVAKATAKFGFTITSQAMAFVDEKHFAHYIMFRIANIRNFQDNLMKYGARGMDYEHDPYSDTIRRITNNDLGGASAAKFYEQQRIYLTKTPVVKAHMPLSGKIKPTVDLGVTSSPVGLDGGISAQFKTSTYFEKEILALPDTSSARALQEKPFTGLKYWEYQADPDGDCAYHSLSFLFKYEGLSDSYRPVQELRNLAAQWIENLYERNQQGESPVWLIDQPLYQDLADYLDWIRSGRTDDTGQHRQWADSTVVAALAECFLCTIHIHQTGQHEVIVLSPNPRPDNPVIHLAFRGNNHYNPLIVKDTENPPVAADELPPTVQHAGDRPVSFNEKGVPLAQLNEATHRLDKRKPATASEVLARKRELQQKYTPRIITLGRMGNSASQGGKVNFESWVNVGLEITRSVINGHINPDNDGIYLNVKTKGSLLQRTFAAPADPPEPPETGDPMTRADLGGQTWAQSKPPDNLGLDKLAKALGPVELKTDFMSRYVEWNYVLEDKGLRKQYRRYAYTSGFSIGVSADVDVYPGVVAGLSFSFGVSKAVTMSESIGTNTLSYLLTVFNGLKLRPNGKKQWDAFCRKHAKSLRVLYRRIGHAKQKDNGNNDKKLPNAYKVARDYETLVRDNKHVWEKFEGSDWCCKKADESDQSFFIQSCLANVSALSASRRQRIKGKLRAKYNPVPGCIDDINDRFTTLFWRVSKVHTLYDERMNPFKRKLRYLIPAKGKISFKTRLGGGGIQLTEAPIIIGPKNKSEETWVRYKSAADIWLNPTLRRAEDALAFYRAGFQIDLAIKLPHSTPTVSLQPVGSVAADNDKDNDELIRQLFIDVALKAVGKRKGNLEDFAALVKLDSDLERIFRSWIMHLGGDSVIHRRFRPKKTVKAKNNYPEAAEGMELLPSDRELLVLDDDGMPMKLSPSQAEKNPISKSIDVSGVPSLRAKYGGEREKNQTVLDVRQKWILKANLLWDEWVCFKQEQLRAETGGAVNTLELILSKIQGPFPGYSDDNDYILTTLESM